MGAAVQWSSVRLHTGDELQKVELQLEPGWAWLITPQPESVGLDSKMVGDSNGSGNQATNSQAAASQAGLRLSASQLGSQIGSKYPLKSDVSKYPPKSGGSKKPLKNNEQHPSSKAQSGSSSSQPRRPLNKSAANKSKEETLRIENLDSEQSPKKKKMTKDEVSKLVERALENAKRKKEAEETDSEMVVRKKKSHLMEDLKVYFAMALLLLIAGGIIVAKINMEPQPARNGTFVPLEQETGSNAKYTASGFIPDHPGYIA